MGPVSQRYLNPQTLGRGGRGQGTKTDELMMFS